MLLPVNEAPEWNSGDASVLSAFVASETGQKVLQLLSFSAPSLLDGSNVNQTLVTSGELKGYMNAVAALLALRTTRPPEARGASENYPDLDDENKWADTETKLR